MVAIIIILSYRYYTKSINFFKGCKIQMLGWRNRICWLHSEIGSRKNSSKRFEINVSSKNDKEIKQPKLSTNFVHKWCHGLLDRGCQGSRILWLILKSRDENYILNIVTSFNDDPLSRAIVFNFKFQYFPSIKVFLGVYV